MNSKIERRVTVLCTFLIFLVLTWIREIVTVRAPNRRSDDKEEKQAVHLHLHLFSENFKLTAPK